MPSFSAHRSAAFALRGPTLSLVDDPFLAGDEAALRYEPDGLILVKDGIITAVGSHAMLKAQVPPGVVTHYPDSLILPGLIDTHVHYPQTQIIGAYGAQLIDWLNEYTFVAEQQYADPDHARAVSRLFLDECLRVGTTTAAVYCTVHPGSVDAFFQAASEYGMRMIAGKVMMDRNAPLPLTDTAQSSHDDTLALINRWHGKGRLHYAITPRFAPTSTPRQLELAGELWRQHPGTYMQTHLSENQAEIEWVRQLFPGRANYLDVYDHYGLTGPRSVFGHAVHLDEREWQRLAESGSAIAHCPTSNTFLGSGLFDFARATRPQPPARPVRTGLATDVGGGTSLSMLRTMGEAYKVGQLGGYSLSAAKALYLATRGAARALYLEDRIGSLEPGLDADLLVLDLKSTPLIEFRMKHCQDIHEALFVQMTMADDRATKAVYVGGRLAYSRN
ncbi:guanine deaminase [Pusillimonas noertemannii]|uniref:Guanine deaminase n=1 Tax=Pusillimonas noertemannii TaxID=305977 RepID=A0A2U1CIB6_9BURK|nr:guanine deaminase [Pusillimonas noertemannii]NYT70795.1 guanine deaminase [Pusillimonas noertemannii]PVY60710.1 guanine deaminase [Pusillimonas noertemannii]TFL08715.1 guanine deaminase [Pusillimonas noertemannii]